MKRKPTQGLVRLFCITGLVGFALATTTGCTGLNHLCGEIKGCMSNHLVDYTNRTMAEKAWLRNKHKYCDFQYEREFKDGFISGYLDIAEGGAGCTPTIAPSRYWGWAYQSPHGQSAVGAYFRGFPYGAKAGEQDGIGYWRSIPTSGINQTLSPYGSGLPASTGPIGEEVPVPNPVLEGIELRLEPQGTPSDLPAQSSINIKSPSDAETNANSLELLAKPNVIDSVIHRYQFSGTSEALLESDTRAESEELTFTFE
jgi:hypothetical protein